MTPTISKSILLSRLFSLMVAIVGYSVLIGWLTTNVKLIRIVDGLAPMVFNTAICFFLVGVGFIFNTLEETKTRKYAAVVASSFVFLLALLTIAEYMVNTGFGIDYVARPGITSTNPYQGRMSVFTATNFIITSICIIADALKWKDEKWIGQYAMLIVFFISFLGLSSIGFGVIHYYSQLTTMALHTALSFLLMTIAYFSWHAKSGIAALFISKSLAGSLIRWILIPLAVFYPIISIIRLYGEEAGFYNSAGGTVFMMVSSLALFTLITLVAARHINRLDREKELYKKFFELSSEVLIIATFDGFIRQTSKAFTKVLGYELSDVSNTHFYNIVFQEDIPKANFIIDNLRTGQPISSFPVRLITKNNQVKHFLWSVTPDQVTGELFAAGYDITEIKEAEQVRALAEKLSLQNKQLASFAHIVSHNLRSPVGNLNSLLQLYKIETSTAERDGLIEKFKRVAEHLSTTLNDLIESLRIKEDISKEKELLRFDDTLSKTQEILTAHIQESQAEITCKFTAKEIRYPRIYLESIFLNVLSNAIKYRSIERPLSIHIESYAEGDKTILKISDNGQGIDLKRHGDKLFGFYKTFHSNNDSKGIGLFLTKTQVEAMGGSISIESEVNKGSTFTIVLGKSS